MALVGYDAIDATGYRGVEITTMSQKTYEMGAMAVKILMDRIEKKTPPMANQIILKPEMIIRDSCGYRLHGYLSDRSSSDGVKAIHGTDPASVG
jgi:LacI family transcriptional regulator